MNKKMFKIQEWLMFNDFDFEVVVDGPHMQIKISGDSKVMLIENEPTETISVSVNKSTPVLIYNGLNLKRIKKHICLAYDMDLINLN